MKTIIISLSIFLLSSVSFAENFGKYKYEIKIVNLTKGQPLTPAVVAVHQDNFELYSLGKEASAGLQYQAKDGAIDLLIKELSNQPAVTAVYNTSGVFLPGQATLVEISANRKSHISVTSMLARTNDAFVGGKNLHLPQKMGEKVTYLLRVYDAGAEINTESCSHIPAPPCNSHLADTKDKEGFVHTHPGIQNIGDLDPLRDAFGVIGAKITIERK